MFRVPIFILILSVLASPTMCSENDSCRIKLAYPKQSMLSANKILEKTSVVPLMVLGFGGFSVLLALGYNSVRKHIFRDYHNLDTAFDAGGRVSFSLTVVTVTSQMLWPSDFLQSTIVASKYGLAGSLWIAMGTVFCTTVFPMMSVHIKTKAPGAKTYLQVIYARFGPPTHILFCCMAIVANLVAISALIMSGKAAFDVLVKDVSDELVVMVLAVIFGSYCFVGGLGTTFYISYFNTAVTFIVVLYFIWTIFYSSETTIDSYPPKQAFYETLKCLETPEGHYQSSYLNFRSFPAFLNGLIMFFIATAMSYCDQACWQSRIAAKPSEGVLGFFVAALVWFGIPTSISLTSSLTYMSMSFHNESHIMTSADIDSGYITPFAMETTMGSTGGYLLITMLTMALMSTGSGEVMAVSSIIVYDIYKVYVNPYRKCRTFTTCLLCGHERVKTADSASELKDMNCTCSLRTSDKKKEKVHKNIEHGRERIPLDGFCSCGFEEEREGNHDTGQNKSLCNAICSCKTSDECEECKEDVKLQMSGQKYGTHYRCPTHGTYRHYEDALIRMKTWCIVWVAIAHIPFGLFLMSTSINLQWSFYVLQILLSPFLVPLLLSLTWVKCTPRGLITGCLFGLLAAICGELAVAATVYPDGLNEFIANTSGEYSVITGVLAGIISSTLVCVILSLKTTKIKSRLDEANEWQKTICINNPLNPWQRIYSEELKRYKPGTNITQEHMSEIFRVSRRVAYIGGGLCLFAMVILMPTILLTFDTLTFDNFSGWITFNHIWCACGALFAILAPPIQECYQIWNQYKTNKEKTNISNQRNKTPSEEFDTAL